MSACSTRFPESIIKMMSAVLIVESQSDKNTVYPRKSFMVETLDARQAIKHL